MLYVPPACDVRGPSSHQLAHQRIAAAQNAERTARELLLSGSTYEAMAAMQECIEHIEAAIPVLPRISKWSLGRQRDRMAARLARTNREVMLRNRRN